MSVPARPLIRLSVPILASLVGLWLLLVTAPSASAVEYRLHVASLYSESFAAFLKRGEYADGAAGPGLDRLESSLDRAQVPPGALLYDRSVEPAGPPTARAYRAVSVPAQVVRGAYAVSGQTSFTGPPAARAEIARGAVTGGQWDEVRWEGKPGEQSLWVISPYTPRHQDLHRMALKGAGPLRQFQPYVLRPNGARLTVASLPLNFLWGFEGSEALWDKYLSRSLDLQSGIAAVVGANHNPLFGDQVFLVVRHGAEPTTYKAVMVWRRRPGVDRGNLEGPGNDTIR